MSDFTSNDLRQINCDDMIEIYAKKAVDVNVGSYIGMNEDSGSFAGSDFTTISSNYVPSNVSNHETGGIPSSSVSVISGLHHPTHQQYLSQFQSQLQSQFNAPFVMPTNVPSKDQWIPDRKMTHCMACKTESSPPFSTVVTIVEDVAAWFAPLVPIKLSSFLKSVP